MLFPNKTVGVSKANNRLRLLRAERHLSQYDVASEMGISFNRFWRIENGHTEPTANEQKAFAKFFGVKVAEVFTEAAA